MRTTSSLEGLNSVIHALFPKKPTIFKFAKNLRLFEASKATDLYQISTGSITTPKLERKRKADRDRDEKIKNLTAELNKENISVTDFLVFMSEEDTLPTVANKL